MDVKSAFESIARSHEAKSTCRLDLAEDSETFNTIALDINDFDHPLHDFKIIDLGCGTGLTLANLALEPGQYLGVDIAPAMIQICKNRYPEHKFMCLPVENLSLEAGTFDMAISLYGSFSYILDPYTFIDTLHTLLAPGGTIFIQAFGVKYPSKMDITERSGVPTAYIPYPNKWLRRIIGRRFSITESYGFSAIPYCLYPHGASAENRAAKMRILEHLPLPLLSLWIRLEAKTIGKFFPDMGYFQVVRGRK